MASPAFITKRRKTQRPAPGTGSPEHSRRVFGGRAPAEQWLIPRYLQGNNFSSRKGWCSLLADLFIQLRFSNSCHGLGLGLIPKRTVSKRVTATGNVQRGLFNLRTVMCGAFFFFFLLLLLQLHILCFQAQKKKSRRHQKTIRRERARLTKARAGFFFFLGTLDFLGNYINSGVFKSVFCRQKGGKLWLSWQREGFHAPPSLFLPITVSIFASLYRNPARSRPILKENKLPRHPAPESGCLKRD